MVNILHVPLGCNKKVLPSSKTTCCLFTTIDIIKDWIENDFKVSGTGTGPSALNVKDVITFLQKLSQVDKQNMSASVLEEWEGKYLKLLYRLCSDTTRLVVSAILCM